jgi:flagellin-like hook-associated protein FlgL
MAQTKFNGISLFARYTEVNGNDEGLFGGTLEQSHRLMVNLSSTGDKTVVASINKSLFLSAITINSRTLDADEFGNADQSTTFRFANKDFSGSGADALMTLGDVSVGVFTQALQNIASLRAENGASSSQLQFGYENIAKQKTNLEQGVSRIMDVDVAAESTRLAKYNVLVQASASMLSQANGLSEVALVLMR